MFYRASFLLFFLFLAGQAWAVPTPEEIVVSPPESVAAGHKIKVYWRWHDADADTRTNTGYFDGRDTLIAGDGPGVVSGAAVHKLLKGLLKYPPAEIWALDVKVGAKPHETRPAIKVPDSAGEYFDNYLSQGNKGTLYLFLDLKQQ